jgi:hypothetical protein
MQTLTSAPSLTPAYLKQNLQEIQDNVVAPVRIRHGRAISFTKIAVAGVLLAFATSGFAQTQQVSAANIALDNQPAAETGNVAVVEKKPATSANQPQSAAGLSKEIANPLSKLVASPDSTEQYAREHAFGQGNIGPEQSAIPAISADSRESAVELDLTSCDPAFHFAAIPRRELKQR